MIKRCGGGGVKKVSHFFRDKRLDTTIIIRKVVLNMVHSYLLFVAGATISSTASAFTLTNNHHHIMALATSSKHPASTTSFKHFSRMGLSGLKMMDDTAKAAPMVTGEELETMLQEWDQPLVVDAYATW